MRRRSVLIGVAVVMLVFMAARHVDWATAGGTLARAAWGPLFAAIAINLASVALRGVRWWIFLRRVGAAPLRVAIRGAIVGSGFNNLLIANSGDATRAVLVSRATGINAASVVASLALDRLFDPICFGLLLLIATFVMPLPPQLSTARPLVVMALIAVAAILVMLSRSEPGAASRRDAAGWRQRARDFRRQIQTLSTPRRFAVAFVVSVGVWALQIATFALAARSVDIQLPLAGTIAAMLLTNAGLILRATPGNVGYFQFAYAVAASRFGVATAPAVAAALLLQLIQIVPTTLLAVTLAPRMVAGTKRSL
jgi:glycosyltransferase 2 family protein